MSGGYIGFSFRAYVDKKVLEGTKGFLLEKIIDFHEKGFIKF